MSTVKLSKYTKEQAEEYANNDADIRGYKKGSAKWQAAFTEYIRESYSSMALGRNPRQGSYKYKAFIAKYPEVFSSEGFAGSVSKGYKSAHGKGLPLEEVQNRIMSSVMNLVKVFENGIMGTMTTTSGAKQGKIANSEMSEFQLPNKEEFSSDEDFQAAKKDVYYNWFQRDVLVDAVLESLMPFFSLNKNNIEKILGAIELVGDDSEASVGAGRLELVDKLRSLVQPQMANVSYTDMLFKK